VPRKEREKTGGRSTRTLGTDPEEEEEEREASSFKVHFLLNFL